MLIKSKILSIGCTDAESQGMIGYLIQQELGNCIAPHPTVTLLTQVVVDKNDPAFKAPAQNPLGLFIIPKKKRKPSQRTWLANCS